jgi:hypothetical protein
MRGAKRVQDLERIGRNLGRVREQIAGAALRSGRNPEDVTLVAVSKTHPLQAIEAAIACGQHDFGENRFDEVWAKIEEANVAGLGGEIRWHFIGTIQSRQSQRAIGPFLLVHAVDRVKIAERLSRDAIAASCVQSVLLEVNVSGEQSKHGFGIDELRGEMANLLRLPGLRIAGLMTMAPIVDDAETVRPIFRTLRGLRDELTDRFGHPLPHLSMGMSGDFAAAVEEGATLVRIGTAIFGERE